MPANLNVKRECMHVLICYMYILNNYGIDEEPVLDFVKACVAIAAILSYSFFVLIVLQCYSAYYFWCLHGNYTQIGPHLDDTLLLPC